jgi:hypothetical protein
MIHLLLLENEILVIEEAKTLIKKVASSKNGVEV